MNEENLKIWKKAFSAAKHYCKLEPWNYLSNSDIVKLTVHGKDVYVMVLGNGGQMYGCSIFVGEEGYKNLFRTFCSLDPDLNLAGIEGAVLQDAIVLDLYSLSEYCYPEQKKILENLGLDTAFPFPRLPFFEHYIPYAYPRACTMEEISLAADVIYELLSHMDYFNIAPFPYYFGGFELYTYNEAEDCMDEITVNAPANSFDAGPLGTISEEELEALRSTPLLDENIEIEVFTSTRVYTLGDITYYDRFAILSIEGGGRYNVEFLEKKEMDGPVVVKLLSEFIREQGRPKEIHVRNCIVQKYAEVIAKPLGIKTMITDLDQGAGYEYFQNAENNMEFPSKETIEQMEHVMIQLAGYSKSDLKAKQFEMGDEYPLWLAEFAIKSLEALGLYESMDSQVKTQAFHKKSNSKTKKRKKKKKK